MNWKSSKFVACILGCIIITWLALESKMDANVATALSVVVGGFYGSNAYVTGKSLANGNGK